MKDWISKKNEYLPANRAVGFSAAGFITGWYFKWFDTPYSFSSAVCYCQ
jgi:hypothetical protein